MSAFKTFAVVVLLLATVLALFSFAQANSTPVDVVAVLNSAKCLALGGKCGAASTCVVPNLSVQRICDEVSTAAVCCVKRVLAP